RFNVYNFGWEYTSGRNRTLESTERAWKRDLFLPKLRQLDSNSECLRKLRLPVDDYVWHVHIKRRHPGCFLADANYSQCGSQPESVREHDSDFGGQYSHGGDRSLDASERDRDDYDA